MKKLVTMIFLIVSLASPSFGQLTNSQENVHDFFATAGYGTAFGAALGAATLPFKNNPEKHLRSVAIGASIGFFTGSLLGSYVIFSPVISTRETNLQEGLAFFSSKDTASLALTGITGTWTIKEF